MKTGWIGVKELKKKFNGEDFIEIQATKGHRDYWLDEQWPPVKVRILTEEEYQELKTRADAPKYDEYTQSSIDRIV